MFRIRFSGKLLTSVWFTCLLLGAVFSATAAGLPVYPYRVLSVSDTLQKTDTLRQKDTLAVSDTAKKEKPMSLQFELIRHAEDSIVQDLAHKKVYLWGKAEVKYGDVDLKAGYIMVNFNNNTVFAKGIKDSTGKIVEKPVFKQGSESFEADSMSYNFVTKKGIVHNVRTEEQQGFLHGDIVKRMPDNSINVKKGWFTTCNLPHPHYEFRFNKARVIPNKLIVTGPVYLEIEGVPMPLILPFGIFPNNPKRQSGLIMPTYGESANRGFYLEGGGYFWAISDYFTLKVTGDIYTGGSWKIAPVLTYKKRYKYSGAFSLSFARNVINTKGDPDYSNTKDFSVIWTYNQDPKAHPNSTFTANVRILTRNFVKYNTVKPDTYLSNEFQSSISYQRNWGQKFHLTLSANQQQNTQTHNLSLSLPDISFSVNTFYPFQKKNSFSKNPLSNLSISYSMAAQNQLRTKDTLLFSGQIDAKDMDNGIIHKIPINLPMKVLKYFNLSISANFTDRMYFRSLRKYWVDTSATGGYVKTDTIPGFNNIFDYNLNASLSTKIYGIVRFRKGFLRAVRHVITPSVGFSYVPDFGKEKWGYTGRYLDTLGQEVVYSKYQGFMYGAPGTQKVGSINFSIANSLEIKVRSRKDTVTGTKKIPLIQNFVISGNYDFARDSVRMSKIYLSGNTTLWKGLTIQYSSALDPYVTDSLGRSINKTEWQVNRRLFRLSNSSWNLSFNFQLSDKDFNKKKKKQEQAEEAKRKEIVKNAPEAEANDILNNPENYIDWGVSWSVDLSYHFTYSNIKRFVNYQWTPQKNLVQTLGLRGQLNITPNWKVTFRTGWDFTNHELSYTSVNLYRNLHCWEMRFGWIPIGPRKSWNFTINVKASILQDLKLTKRKDFRDYY